METKKYLALVYVLGALLFAVIFLNYGGCSHSQQTFASDTTMVLDTDTDLKLGIDTASMPPTITPQENPHSVGNNTDVGIVKDCEPDNNRTVVYWNLRRV